MHTVEMLKKLFSSCWLNLVYLVIADDESSWTSIIVSPPSSSFCCSFRIWSSLKIDCYRKIKVELTLVLGKALILSSWGFRSNAFRHLEHGPIPDPHSLLDHLAQAFLEWHQKWLRGVRWWFQQVKQLSFQLVQAGAKVYWMCGYIKKLYKKYSNKLFVFSNWDVPSD